MANAATYWQDIILNNLQELIECTGIGNLLVVSLFQSKMIDRGQMHYLMDSRNSPTERATLLYTEIAVTWEDKNFLDFRKALKAGNNGKALTYFENATWNEPTTDATKSGSNSGSAAAPGDNALNNYKNGKRFALIINVPTRRIGSQKDEVDLLETLRRCNFDVDICDDLTKDGIFGKLQSFQNKTIDAAKNGDVGAVVIAVAGHGDSYDYFLTSDECTLNLNTDVIDLFNGKNSRELNEVPKVFLVNICRGDKVDAPNVESDSSNSFGPSDNPQGRSRSFDTWMKSQVPPRTEADAVKIPLLPTWAHLIVAFASYDGHVAYRDTQEGTWFFQEFCERVKNMTRDGPKCIKTILDKVSEEVSRKTTERGEKQMPTWKNVGFSRSLLFHFR